ncbi:MAG: phosphoribosylglycinamide formyltransferase, partial [Myxococcota bacterium]
MSPSLPLIERAPCTPGAPLRVAVLVSGSGSNLQALLDDSRVEGSPYQVCCVLSNRPAVRVLERASDAGIAHDDDDHRGFPSRGAFEEGMLTALGPYAPEIVVLAGFMRVLTATFVERFSLRIVNVHPALCPAFPGNHAARQALDAGARVTGCTVHLVDTGVDTGPILAQAAVPILDDDDEERLQRRIQV